MAIKKYLAATSLIGASFASLGQTAFIVEDLKVEGLQRVALGAALTHIPINVGDNLDDYTISKTIKSLYGSGHFDNIKVLHKLRIAIKGSSSILFKRINKCPIPIRLVQLTKNLYTSPHGKYLV